jgi:alpha-D-ribose 1-methylphosphonate 5-triphosphate diphosphatase
MHVLMGAPNILRGNSLTNNLSGREAIQQGCCNIIGSDYSPAMMLHAIFTLHRLKMGPLNELVKMVSYNPAKALGIDDHLGSIQEGLWADLVLVDTSDPVPRVVKTFVNGKQVFSAF